MTRRPVDYFFYSRSGAKKPITYIEEQTSRLAQVKPVSSGQGRPKCYAEKKKEKKGPQMTNRTRSAIIVM